MSRDTRVTVLRDGQCNTPSLFLKQILDVNNTSNEFYFSLSWLIILQKSLEYLKHYNGIFVICGNELGEN